MIQIVTQQSNARPYRNLPDTQLHSRQWISGRALRALFPLARRVRTRGTQTGRHGVHRRARQGHHEVELTVLAEDESSASVLAAALARAAAS